MKILFLICFVALSFSAFSQGNNYLGIEAQHRAGIIIAHRGLMSHIPESHALGAEISIYYQTNGKSTYHQLYNYPKYGIKLIGSTVGNDRILGNMFGAVAFGDFPFFNIKNNELSGNVGVGLSYFTKIYDPVKNPKDVAISTHINALINLGLKYRYYFKNNLNFVLGFDLTHNSNGASRVPNLGVNLIYTSIGVGYQFKNVEFNTKEHQLNIDKKWKFNITGVLSFKEVYPIHGKLFPVGNLSFIATKRFTPKSGIELYADGFYKPSTLSNPSLVDANKWNVTQAGIMGAYNLYINRLRIHVGLGAYVYDKFNPDGRFYTRLGFKYQINKHLLATIGLKSHWAKADYIEYGIGYTF
ncbi:MAG TPA: acyloxyacyl hydrolase [Crocinitomicaceae bacterium]|nr:acyloxyacyl hydrolase [Crocinitomicaceae bacterium]